MNLSDLHTSAYDYLMSGLQRVVIDSLVSEGYLGFDHYPDSLVPDQTKPWSTGWVFRSDNDGAPFRTIEGSGRGAICLSVYDSWASSSMWHSSSFPNLHIAIYGDPTRNAQDFPGMPSKYSSFDSFMDGRQRALRIYEKIHPLFHDSSNRIHRFADLPVVSTVAGGGFTIDDIPGGDGLVRLNQVYNIHI